MVILKVATVQELIRLSWVRALDAKTDHKKTNSNKTIKKQTNSGRFAQIM